MILARPWDSHLPDQLPVDQASDLDRHVALALLQLVGDVVQRQGLRVQVEKAEYPALKLRQHPGGCGRRAHSIREHPGQTVHRITSRLL